MSEIEVEDLNSLELTATILPLPSSNNSGISYNNRGCHYQFVNTPFKIAVSLISNSNGK